MARAKRWHTPWQRLKRAQRFSEKEAKLCFPYDICGRCSMWIDVGPREALPAGGMLEVEAGHLAVLLYDLAGAVHATDAICPHHAAWLSAGRISGSAIDCPRHQGRFDIKTGRQLRGPDCSDLRTYNTRILHGRIQLWVQIPPQIRP